MNKRDLNRWLKEFEEHRRNQLQEDYRNLIASEQVKACQQAAPHAPIVHALATQLKDALITAQNDALQNINTLEPYHYGIITQLKHYTDGLSVNETMDKLMINIISSKDQWEQTSPLNKQLVALEQQFAALRATLKGKNYLEARTYLLQLGFPVPHDVSQDSSLPAIPLDLELLRGTLTAEQATEFTTLYDEHRGGDHGSDPASNTITD